MEATFRRPAVVVLLVVLSMLAIASIILFFLAPIQVQNSNSIELERLVLATKPLSQMSIDEILQLITYKVTDHLHVLYGVVFLLSIAVGAWKVVSEKP